MYFFIALALIAVAFPESFWEQPAALAIGVSVIVTLALSTTYRLSLAIFMGWMIATSFYAMGFIQYSDPKLIGLDAMIGMNLAWLLLVVLFNVTCQPVNIEKYLGILCFCNGTLGIFRFFTVGTALGASNIISLNAAFTATLLPFTFKRPLWFAVAAVSILLQPGAIAITLLLLYGGFLVGRLFVPSKAFLVGLVACGVCFILAFSFHVSYDAGGRASIWAMAIESANTFHNHIGGTGVGSWGLLGPMFQRVHVLRVEEIWPALHGDWVQLFCESGLIGLILGAWCYLDAMRHSLKWSINWFLSALGIGLFVTFYYPFHVPFIAFIYAAMLFKILQK